MNQKYSVKYAFTVTLTPKSFIYDATRQFDLTFIPLYKHLSCLSTRFECVAELTKAFNVHYHGIIQFPLCDKSKNCMKSFVDSFRGNKLFGFVNIKQIDDESKWYKYIAKDVPCTRQLLNRPPILRDSMILLTVIELSGDKCEVTDVNNFIQDIDNFGVNY